MKADKEIVSNIVRTIYGLKYSDLQFRNCLTETLGNQNGYKSSLADPDICYKPMNDADNFEYYSYILVYVDNLLLIMKYPK